MIDIQWNKKKCPTPRDCRKCLELCPQGVYIVYGQGGRQPGKTEDDWVIAPGFIHLCDGCKRCEEFCPQHALKVTVKVQDNTSPSLASRVRKRYYEYIGMIKLILISFKLWLRLQFRRRSQ